MRVVVHRIDHPLRSLPVMGHVHDAEQNRIAHVDIRRSHIDLRAQHVRSIFEISGPHPVEEFEIFFDRSIAVRTVPARLRQRPAILADLFRRQAVDKAQQSAHLLAHRVALLLCQDQSSMGLTLSMKAAKIGDVEALKDSFFRRREGEVVVVRPLDPVRLMCGQHVHSSGSKRGNRGPVHGVFVEIETNSHTGREPAVSI